MKLILIPLFLISTYCFSQKQYEFDYLIAYEVSFYKDSIKVKNLPVKEKNVTIKKYYLTNSKKNNYSAVITELDSLNFKMIFKDENGIFSDITFLKSEFNKAEYINIDCKYISNYQNPYTYQTKNYDFFKLTDTVISGETHKKFKLASIKPKKVKRKKLGTQYYIIKNKTSFHLPVLDFSTAYEEWKTNGNLPNGIFLEKYFINYYGQLTSNEKLINYYKIDKKIVINKDCDYTKKKLKTK